MKIYIQLAVIIVAAVLAIVVSVLFTVSYKAEKSRTICSQFGSSYKFVAGYSSPDLCTDNNGNVRYPDAR